MGMFKRTKKYSIILSRAISEMEQIQFTLTSDDKSEFSELLQAAENAVQVQADRFQNQLKAAEEAAAAERENRVKNGKAK